MTKVKVMGSRSLSPARFFLGWRKPWGWRKMLKMGIHQRGRLYSRFLKLNTVGNSGRWGEHIAGMGLHNCRHRGTWTKARKTTGSQIALMQLEKMWNNLLWPRAVKLVTHASELRIPKEIDLQPNPAAARGESNTASPKGRSQGHQGPGPFPEGLSWMAPAGGHSGQPRWLVTRRCLDRISHQVCSSPFHIRNVLLCLPRLPSWARSPSPLACCQMELTCARWLPCSETSYRTNLQPLSLAPHVDLPKQLATAARSVCLQVMTTMSWLPQERDYVCTWQILH